MKEKLVHAINVVTHYKIVTYERKIHECRVGGIELCWCFFEYFYKAVAMEYKKLPRKANAREFQSSEWRLASTDELEYIATNPILGPWDTVRLLDGWVSGSGFNYERKKGYKSDIEEMLLVKVSNPSGIYSGVKLRPEGREAALLLFWEDNITHVILLVLNSIVDDYEKAEQRQAQLDLLMESIKKKFRNERTLMHYAADQKHNKNLATDIAKVLVENFESGKKIVKAKDKNGTTALHFAAFHGNTELCKFLIEGCQMETNEKNEKGENLLHFAVNGPLALSVFKDLCELQGVKETIASQDAQGKTPLHKAAARGRIAKIRELLSKVTGNDEKTKLIRQADLFGGTALHEATRGSHERVVEILLGNGSSPLFERESDGKTALHYAVKICYDPSEEERSLYDGKAVRIAKLLLDNCQSEEERSLLLWASATGIGTAEESAESSHNLNVKKYLEDERERIRENSETLLKSAIKLRDDNMAWELVNRGANPDELTSCFPRESEEGKRAQSFRDKIEKMPERGRDQPTIEDGLGRKHYVEGLAALFLNPYVKTPVTVGIFGPWGMGKSSLMIQTEITLLQTAAQLAFPHLLETEDFPGSIQFVLSKNGRRKYEKIKNAVKDLKIEDSTNSDANPLMSFLDKYHQEYHQVYRSLALMDRKEMFDVKDAKSDSTSKRYSVGNIPTILPVRYNAWQYQNEQEAWAGLAVEIPKAIEEAMTSAQRIRCRWRYAWKEHRNEIYLELFLPCLLALFLSFWVALVLWTLFSRYKNKELVKIAYGSIPITIVLAVWTVVKQVLSVIKPLSAQITGYVRKQDHSVNLGYQHQVISDINFSRKQLGEKPSLLWKFIAWLWSFCGLYPDTIEGTSIPKSAPPCKDDIRIIVFVDDLDRCEDAVILKVLSAVSLVLAVCEINVILGMDEKMVRRAIKNKFKDHKHPKALALKYINKIVQLPLAIPDANKDEMEGFLKQQLGPEYESHSNVAEQNQTAGSTDNSEAHASLDMSCSTTESYADLSSQMSQLSEPLLKNNLSDPKEKKLSTPLKSMQLLPNYSPKEREAITSLSEVAGHSQRLPREWKGFLTYHRVAWNILHTSAQVRNCPGWQVQLIVWIFCCWQWKDQINIIIKKWEKLVPINGASRNHDEPSLPNIDANSSPDSKANSIQEEEEAEEEDLSISSKHSLGNIVQRHIEEVEAEKQADAKKQTEGEPKAEEAKAEQEMEDEKEGKGYEKVEEEEKQKGKTKVKTNGVGIAKEKEKEDEEEKEEEKKWKDLKTLLIKYDVSMDCIQCFQKFRVHCKIKNLRPPLSGSSVM